MRRNLFGMPLCTDILALAFLAGLSLPAAAAQPLKTAPKWKGVPINGTPIVCVSEVSGSLVSTDEDYYEDGTRADFFNFSIPSPTTISISFEGNFDEYLEVLDGGGNSVASTDFFDVLDDTLTVRLPAGDYTIIVNNFDAEPLPLSYTLSMRCFEHLDCGASLPGLLTEDDEDVYDDGTRADFFSFRGETGKVTEISVSAALELYFEWYKDLLVYDAEHDDPTLPFTIYVDGTELWTLLVNNMNVAGFPLSYEVSSECFDIIGCD